MVGLPSMVLGSAAGSGAGATVPRLPKKNDPRVSVWITPLALAVRLSSLPSCASLLLRRFKREESTLPRRLRGGSPSSPPSLPRCGVTPTITSGSEREVRLLRRTIRSSSPSIARLSFRGGWLPPLPLPPSRSASSPRDMRTCRYASWGVSLASEE